MERIAVFHNKLARSHNPETGPEFIAKFSLDLVKIHRQLAIAVQFIACDVGDHLFVRRPVDEVAVVPILHFQHLAFHRVDPTRFLPQFGGLNGWHQEFLGT